MVTNLLVSFIVSGANATSGLVTKTIDFRSDTFTKPSKEMLQKMMEAEVGDDVHKEDPTVNKLEETCADLLGMEKSLFVPTGTMGNLICLMSHCMGRGEELIIGDKQHVYCYEQGHFMQLASIAARVIPNEADGTLSLKNIENNIQDDSDFHMSKTSLICLENTHMLAGGIPLKLEYMQQVGQLAKKYNIPVHVDGARIYNAALSLNCHVKDLLIHADSVSMCLSKGLGCPVGSVIGGSKEFIARASRIRKAVGGGMRQSGFLAAAGLYALKHAYTTLNHDHVNAATLAHGINDLDRHDYIYVERCETNIMMARTKEGYAEYIGDMLTKRGVLVTVFDSSTIRFVTHLGISNDDILCTIEQISHVTKAIDLTLK